MKNNDVLSLHSHSGLERRIGLNKRSVLIDEMFKHHFDGLDVKPKRVTYNGIRYYAVPVIEFIKKGGKFKNLDG